MILVIIVVKIKIWNENRIWMLNEEITNYELVIKVELTYTDKCKWFNNNF
jgi:hypothetical protein